MPFLNHLRNLQERARFLCGPHISRWLLHISTYQARRRLPRSPSVRILVDNTVRASAVTHETAWISTGTSMWGGVHPVETGYSARVPVYSPDNTSEAYRNVCYLAGIGYLATKGFVELCTSAELDDERMRQPGGRFTGYGYFDHNVLGDVRMKRIDSLVGSWVIGPGSSPLRDQQQKRIRNSGDPLYIALVKRLGEKQNLDAWHIRTAEKNDMFCFLTTDFKLRRSVERWQSYEPFKSMKVRVMTPEEFGGEFGILPIPPHLHSYANASFHVRSDLHMPGERRRHVSAYRKVSKPREVGGDNV